LRAGQLISPPSVLRDGDSTFGLPCLHLSATCHLLKSAQRAADGLAELRGRPRVVGSQDQGSDGTGQGASPLQQAGIHATHEHDHG